MKRREFFEKAGLGSAALASLSALAAAGTEAKEQHAHHPQSGPLSNAVVSFGQWPSDFTPPLDRYPNAPLTPAQNVHLLLPNEAVIKAGGAVMFVIAGLHQIIVYDDGTEPTQINANLTVPTTGVPAGVPLINDPNGRIYRGVDPSLFPRDRSESVHFPKPGRYLVICGVRGHFVNDDMFGYVRVLP
jgi:hypothetical protein